MRMILGVVLALAAVLVSLWQLDVVSPPVSRFASRESEQVMASRALLEAVTANDLTAVQASLAQGADVRMRDADGLTPLMQAASGGADDKLVRLLLAAGSNPNESSNSGMTPLMYGALNGNPMILETLLQVGANPTLQDATGRRAVDYAAAQPNLQGMAVLETLTSLSNLAYDPAWPSAFAMPIAGATMSSRVSHLPNARRAYRNGFHEGFDFYDGVVSVPIAYGMPTVAVAPGRVVRIDHDYQELSPERLQSLLDEAAQLADTPEDTLDLLRGRQVWLEHAGGYISRYAHLADVTENLQVGSVVNTGDIVGYVGNSGTDDAAAGTQDFPHLHYELWRADTYLGQNLAPDAIYDRVAQVFGGAALPPIREN